MTLVEELPVSRRTKVFGGIVCLVAVISLASWPAWKLLAAKQASAALYQRTKAVVDKSPHLRPAWDKALEERWPWKKDGVLTRAEAKEILESAGETVGPDE
jgi:hypothetical protein